MIKGYGDKDIKNLYEDYKCPKWFPRELIKIAYAKLYLLDAAQSEKDLIIPPSNKYEHLKGSRKGQSSIRINVQWRLTFIWKDGNAFEVRIEDYH
jgi:proteic killer suppression protein